MKPYRLNRRLKVMAIDQEQFQAYRRDGYVVARGLFSRPEVEALCDHFMRLRASGTYPGDFVGVDPRSEDPLKRYPRMIHMHRWDAISLRWLLDTRLRGCLRALLGDDPYVVQIMLYFKPPGARGQALHQDQYFLRVRPGTCMAAWLALDRSDEENGCMQVVPASHTLPLLCTVEADVSQSFTDIAVPLPEGTHPVPVVMEAGDVLFFNGQLIHGSYPNTSAGRFRRALIGHYIVAEAEQVAKYYHPVLGMDGSQVGLGVSQGGGLCGSWVDVDGAPRVEMRGEGMPAEMPTE